MSWTKLFTSLFWRIGCYIFNYELRYYLLTERKIVLYQCTFKQQYVFLFLLKYCICHPICLTLKADYFFRLEIRYAQRWMIETRRNCKNKFEKNVKINFGCSTYSVKQPCHFEAEKNENFKVTHKNKTKNRVKKLGAVLIFIFDSSIEF